MPWLAKTLSCWQSMSRQTAGCQLPNFWKRPRILSRFSMMSRVLCSKLYGVYKFPESFVITKGGMIDDKVIECHRFGPP